MDHECGGYCPCWLGSFDIGGRGIARIATGVEVVGLDDREKRRSQKRRAQELDRIVVPVPSICYHPLTED